MSLKGTKVLVVAGASAGSPWLTQKSYLRAFSSLGCDVSYYSLQEAMEKHQRFGVVGRLLSSYYPVDSWMRKANRDLAVAVTRAAPDVLVFVGETILLVGALAELRSNPRTRIVLVWPDTLLNLSNLVVATLPLFDLVASYGEHTLDNFRRLGARTVAWVPLAADPARFAATGGGASVPDRAHHRAYECDVSFVGNWQREREETVTAILKAPDIDLKIWGATWGEAARRVPAIARAWQGEGPATDDTAMAAAASKICLNVINEMNYPSANLRFFEIPGAGGLQLTSRCPEMEPLYVDGETVFYYSDPEDALSKTRMLLADPDLRRRVAEAGKEKTLREHTYVQRAEQIVDALNLSATAAGSPRPAARFTP